MSHLITGVNGFLGRQVAKSLCDRGESVFGVGRSNSTLALPNYSHIKADLSNPEWLQKIPNNIKIIHHYAQSSQYREVPEGFQDMFQINVACTQYLLEWSRKNSVEKFIFTSTGNVYNGVNMTYTEQDKVNPTSFYANSKLIAERLVQSYAPFFSTIIYRIFGLYGVGQKNMLIPNLIEKIKNGRPIQIVGDKGLVINPIEVNDAALTICTIGAANGAQNLILNIGGNEVLSIKEMALIMGECLEISPVFEVNEGNPNYLVGSIEQLAKYYPVDKYLTFKEGMKKMIHG